MDSAERHNRWVRENQIRNQQIREEVRRGVKRGVRQGQDSEYERERFKGYLKVGILLILGLELYALFNGNLSNDPFFSKQDLQNFYYIIFGTIVVAILFWFRQVKWIYRRISGGTKTPLIIIIVVCIIVWFLLTTKTTTNGMQNVDSDVLIINGVEIPTAPTKLGFEPNRNEEKCIMDCVKKCNIPNGFDKTVIKYKIDSDGMFECNCACYSKK